jgi:mycofactocin system glycosyltransferase
VADLTPLAPSPTDTPLEAGTLVVFDDEATFLDAGFVAGGAPWRLLRLPGGSRTVAERWKRGGPVRAGEERFARTLVQQGLLHPVYRADGDVDDVDIVIPVKDDVDSLRQLLEQLRGLHVTVIDDGTVNPVLVADCARRFDAALIRLETNVGPAGARNAGVAATTRPLVCFLDADVSLDDAPDTIRRLGAQFQDPLLGACAPRIRGGAGDSARDRFERRFSPLDMGAKNALVVPGGPVGYVPSACLMVRRTSFGEGFDERLRSGEDVDLAWRLHDRGWLVRYVADVVVTHRARGSWRQWLRQRVDYGASSGELALRHGARMAPVRSDPWTLVAWTSVLLGKPMIGARVVRVVRDHLRARISGEEDARGVADNVVNKAMIGAGGPLARALVRTFGLAILALALHPRLRRKALVVFGVGTAWRWRHERLRLADVPLAVADDAAYGVGVMKGAWQTRSLAALTPRINKSSVTLRDVLGLSSPGQGLRSPRSE